MKVAIHLVPMHTGQHNENQFCRATSSSARFVKSNRGTAPLLALAAGALLLLLGLAGCSGLIASKTSTPATATLTANPATLSFGDVTLGNDSAQNQP